MTKRLNMSSPARDEEPKRKTAWGHWISFWFLIAIGVVSGLGVGSKASERPLAGISNILSGAVHKTVTQVPRSL